MASEDPNAAGFSSRPGRKPPTLDLKAEEVRVEKQPETEAAKTTAPGEESRADDATANAATPAADADTPQPSAPEAVQAPPTPETPEATSADTLPCDTEAPAAESPAAEAPPSEAPAAEAPAAKALATKRAGLSFGGLVAAVVVGALAGGAAGGGVVYYLSDYAAPPPELETLKAEVAALDLRPSGDPAALSALGQKIDALDSVLAQIRQDVKQAQDTAAARPATAAPALPADLTQKLAALQAAAGETKTALGQAGVEVGKLAAAQAKLSDSQGKLAEAQSKLEAAATTARESATGAAQQVEALSGRLDTVAKDAAKGASSAAEVAQQVATLTNRIDATGARIAEVQKEAAARAASATAFNRAAAGMVILGTLREKVLSGGPFAAELKAARAALGEKADVLAPLSEAADKGFPAPAALADRLSQEGAAALLALAPPPPAAPESLVGRFLSSAESLVSIRPAGSPDGADTKAALARAVALVRAGDLDGAVAVLKQLPAPVADKLKAVTGQIEARRQAAELASMLYQQSLAALSGKMP